MRTVNAVFAMMLTLAAAGAAMSASPAARADSGTHVDAIEVRGLQAYAGKTLSVYYVSARPAALFVPGSHLEIHRVMMGPLQFEIPSSGEVDIEAQTVPNYRFTHYSHIVFAVSGSSSPASLLHDPDINSPDVLRVTAERQGFVYYGDLDRYRDNFGQIVLTAGSSFSF